MISIRTTRLSGRVLFVLALAALPSRAADLTLIPDETCYGTAGATVTVNIGMTNAGAIVVGGQFFLRYDPSVLQFQDMMPGDDPFVVEVFEAVPGDGGAGTIDYAVSTVSGGPGTSSDSTMAVIQFTALTEFCGLSDLVSFRPHDPPTRLSGEGGAEISVTPTDLGSVRVDIVPPTITCPSDTTVTVGDPTDPGDTGDATANDNCPGDITVTFEDAIATGTCPILRVITRTWSAEDSCGHIDTCDQTIVVEYEDSDGDGSVECADLSLTPDETCYGSAGATVIVSIDLANAEVAVVGGQFFLQYDQTKLSFLSADPGDAPFTVEIYECSTTVSPPGCTPTAGLIDYAVSTVSGGAGTLSNSTMARVRFTALAEFCGLSGLVSFRPHEPPTRLSALGGSEVPATLTDLGSVGVDAVQPTITCPIDTTVTEGDSTDPADTGSATATDNCPGDITVTFEDAIATGTCPILRVITRTWSAEDSCGHIDTCDQIISVEDIDTDGDGVVDCDDNCPTVANPANTGPFDCNGDGDTTDPGEGVGEQCDSDGNGIGDACDAPPEVVPDPEGEKNRFISFSAPVLAVSPGGQTAIKVTMIDLQHPKPGNLPQHTPSDFITFDTRLNGVCVGGSYPGHHCDSDADCRMCVGGNIDGRVCTDDVATDCDPPGYPSAACPPGGTCTPLFACTAIGEMNGCARWVGKPGIFLESQDLPGVGRFTGARLQCSPYYHDFAGEGLLHVTGAEIVPSSVYEVEVFGSACEGNESTCTAVSAPVPMYTRRSGDVTPGYNPPVTTVQPDALDVAQLVNKFKSLPGAPIKAIAQLQPNLPELNADVNALDIVAVVDAVRQFKYAFSGPCPCPSTVMCGSMPCAIPSDCVPTFGAGAMCVKTCTLGPKVGLPCINAQSCGSCAGGVNAGQPCDLINDCPGSLCTLGVCGAGFCRDRCGRCTTPP